MKTEEKKKLRQAEDETGHGNWMKRGRIKVPIFPPGKLISVPNVFKEYFQVPICTGTAGQVWVQSDVGISYKTNKML